MNFKKRQLNKPVGQVECDPVRPLNVSTNKYLSRTTIHVGSLYPRLGRAPVGPEKKPVTKGTSPLLGVHN